MHIAVIGGKVQGIEACYLAKKAGWQVRLIDKRPSVPAKGLCDSFFQLDTQHDKDLPRVLDGVDLIIPAFEDEPALERISRWAEQAGIPCAFDIDTYRLSSSKSASNRLFQELNLPMPKLWPDCDFPVILKPDGGSGSRGVQIFKNITDWNSKYSYSEPEDPFIVQEYAIGDSFSLEVLGFPGAYQPLQITDLYMDDAFDCKRVVAPTKLSSEMREEFKLMSVSLAEALGLKGLMDVEVVENEGCLKILEIDARLPSQTPITVFWSTGLNMVELLGALFTTNSGGRPFSPGLETDDALGVIIEHIAVNEQRLEITGEHIMAVQEHLQFHKDFFGAEEAITNYSPGRKQWAATLINTGANRGAAWERRNRVIREIMKEHDLTQYSDPEPVL